MGGLGAKKPGKNNRFLSPGFIYQLFPKLITRVWSM